ncbi:MAG: hypothetical protein WCC12_16310, partial [Anaerolineales bacterium]
MIVVWRVGATDQHWGLSLAAPVCAADRVRVCQQTDRPAHQQEVAVPMVMGRGFPRASVEGRKGAGHRRA